MKKPIFLVLLVLVGSTLVLLNYSGYLGNEEKDPMDPGGDVDRVGDAGIVFYQQNSFQEAQWRLALSLDIKRANLGIEHPSTLRTGIFLALTHQAQENHLEAIPLFREMIRYTEKYYGASDRNTAFLQYSIAVSLASIGELKEAETYLAISLRSVEAMPDIPIEDVWRIKAALRTVTHRMEFSESSS